MAVSGVQKTYNTYNSLPLKAFVAVPFFGNMAAAFAEGQIAVYLNASSDPFEEQRDLLKLKNQFKAIQIVGGVALAIALAVLLAKGICPDVRFKAMAYLMISAAVIYNSYNAYCYYKNRHVIEVMRQGDVLSGKTLESHYKYLRFY